MRRLYQAVAIPKMTYGADIWYSPPNDITSIKRSSGLAKATRQLAKIQCTATLAITGALRTTPTDTLDLHAGLLPIDLTMQKVCHRALTRICTLPESNPLHDIIREYATKYAKRHRTPLHRLLRLDPEAYPGTLETIEPPTRPPAYTPPLTTEIARDRQASIEEEANSEPEIKVFTDGSGYEGKIGAAAVMYRKGRKNPARILRYHLGSAKTHTVFEGEVVGAILGAWMIRSEHITGILPISVLTDSQALIKRVNS
jgi:hypothetical protein